MAPPDSAFHCHTRSMKPSRPSACRVVPSAASWRSTTIWVAMPAWSVPGCHSASRPCMRRQRISASCSVMVSAWPTCRLPVTLGGGIMMVNGSAPPSGRAANAPSRSHASYRAVSTAAGEKVLSSMQRF